MADRIAIRDALADLYARGELSPALAQALGMSPIASPVNLARHGTAVSDLLSGRVSELYRVGEARLGPNSAGLYLAFVDEWHARSSDREPFRRKVARVLVEHMPQDGRWICVLLDGQRQFSEAEVILPRRRQGAKSAAGTTRATVNLKDPTHHHLALLAGLDARGLSSLAALSRKWNDEFSVEVVTNKFHREFRELRDRFVLAVVDANPGNPALAPLLANLPAETRTSTKKRDDALLKDLNLLAFGTASSDGCSSSGSSSKSAGSAARPATASKTTSNASSSSMPPPAAMASSTMSSPQSSSTPLASLFPTPPIATPWPNSVPSRSSVAASSAPTPSKSSSSRSPRTASGTLAATLSFRPCASSSNRSPPAMSTAPRPRSSSSPTTKTRPTTSSSCSAALPTTASKPVASRATSV